MKKRESIALKNRTFCILRSCSVAGIISLQLIILLIGTVRAESENSLWQALSQGGHIALLRHAIAPGTGDPANFRLHDCSTQRNLSEVGRTQAENIGHQLREQGIKDARVYSSQWCRCIETAQLLGFENVEELPLLNSFFREFQRQEPQTKQLGEWLARQTLDTPTILVTHQVNITALTGIFPQSGELIIAKVTGGKIATIGTVKTPY